MAKETTVPRCAWCGHHKEDLGGLLINIRQEDERNSSWVGKVCMTCYRYLGSMHYTSARAEYLLQVDFDELPDSLKADVAILRMAPPNKHVQGIGIRLDEPYYKPMEVVLLDP